LSARRLLQGILPRYLGPGWCSLRAVSPLEWCVDADQSSKLWDLWRRHREQRRDATVPLTGANITEEQICSYANDGFLLFADAVNRKNVDRARRALMAKIPSAHGNPHHAFVSHSAVLACFNKQVCSGAAVLAGERKRF